VSGNLDWSILFKPAFGGQLTDAVLLTIEIAAYAWVAAMVIGLLVGIAREAPSGVARWVAAAHVEVFQNIPVLCNCSLSITSYRGCCRFICVANCSVSAGRRSAR
jgi:ABC-type amino acid transport system permease subunit